MSINFLLSQIKAAIQSSSRNIRTRLTALRQISRQNDKSIERYVSSLSLTIDKKLNKLNSSKEYSDDISEKIKSLYEKYNTIFGIFVDLTKENTTISDLLSDIIVNIKSYKDELASNIEILKRELSSAETSLFNILRSDEEKIESKQNLDDSIKNTKQSYLDELKEKIKNEPGFLGRLAKILGSSLGAAAAAVSPLVTGEAPKLAPPRPKYSSPPGEVPTEKSSSTTSPRPSTSPTPPPRIIPGKPGDFGIEYRTRKEMRQQGERYGTVPGNRTVFLDYNSVGQTSRAKGWEIVVPDDITKEELERVRQNRDGFVNLAAQHGYENYRIRSGGKYGPGIFTTSENRRRRNGRSGGVSGTFHTEPGFAGDPGFQKLMGNENFVKDYARLNADTLGNIPGVTFQTPHGDRSAPSGASMRLPDGTVVTERSLAPSILDEMKKYKEKSLNKPQTTPPQLRSQPQPQTTPPQLRSQSQPQTRVPQSRSQSQPQTTPPQLSSQPQPQTRVPQSRSQSQPQTRSKPQPRQQPKANRPEPKTNPQIKKPRPSDRNGIFSKEAMKEANDYFDSIIKYSEEIKPKSKNSNLKPSGSGNPSNRNAATENQTPPSNRDAATENQTPPSNRDAATGINSEAHMSDT
jgi:hypothetical protein